MLCLSALVACGSGSSGGGGGSNELQAQVVASGLASPVHLSSPPGDARLFVVEQAGRVRIIKNGQLLATPFLDLSTRVSSGGERGLLSIAFHPQFASNGHFYVNYTDGSGDTRIERYRVSANPDIADAGSAKLILSVDQPFSNHNGGHILFGQDGMLYVAMGDGGSGGDPLGHAQNLNTLHGALLRIDVDNGDPYGIPVDNPFVGNPNARAEIWAYGLRNPWRVAFDRQAGLLYIADVGQAQWEEVNAAAATASGRNYGWNVMEGPQCFNAGACNTAGLTPPVLAYDHSEGCSIIGGYVYRGSAQPAIAGHYFYSDFCSGFLRSFVYANGAAIDERQWTVGDLGRVLSFGEDAAGELYVLSQNGNVYRLAGV